MMMATGHIVTRNINEFNRGASGSSEAAAKSQGMVLQEGFIFVNA